MNIIDRIRLESAVTRADFWMDYRGVPGKRRRELRRELRANLTDAAADSGMARAIFGVGSPRAFAFEVAESHTARPRWTFGACWGGAVLTLLTWTWLASLFGFVDGVDASRVMGEVSGDMTFWGGTAPANADGSGVSFGSTIPWTVLILPFVVTVLAAQPWRPLTHRGHARTRTTTSV